ncbi:hypothetical protein PILCRDRAFT_192411 [Piloderma croceum F 1598]|uniref:Uncharacterized protein n=1 Tax=Piloderma croceum (strain F 1598) TaxID=765440 RepID=A0A0C3BT17_PILCF|nr:hypothetical protein PILCRDRAFT_192411 [Piloderma croceum F 1598]
MCDRFASPTIQSEGWLSQNPTIKPSMSHRRLASSFGLFYVHRRTNLWGPDNITFLMRECRSISLKIRLPSFQCWSYHLPRTAT